MSSHLVEPPPITVNLVDDFSEAEDDVDQLDSDSAQDSSPSGSSRQNSTRILGESLLPTVRLENIIQADGVTGNLALSKEGLFVLSVATEEFIKRLAQGGHRQAGFERRNVINYSDMSATTQQYQEFMFLQETIPSPVSLSDALHLRELKEKELADDDPALSLSSSANPADSISTAGPNSQAPKAKAKARVNGKERRNGAASASSSRAGSQSRSHSRSQRDHDTPAEVVDISDSVDISGSRRPSLNGESQSLSREQALARRPVQNGLRTAPMRPSPLANGNGHSSSTSRSGTVTPAPPLERLEPLPPSTYPQQRRIQQDEVRPTQHTSPTNGLLQGPGGPFGQPIDNPGRTIYTQQRTT